MSDDHSSNSEFPPTLPPRTPAVAGFGPDGSPGGNANDNPHATTDHPPRDSSPFDAPASAHVPGYQLLGVLGRGGMGVVYQARHLKLNRVVALKMILHGGHAEAKEHERFLREAEVIAAIKHAGVVQVYDYGTHDGAPFFALEFCEGGSLAKKLAGKPLPSREAADLVAQVARAVQAAHEAGVVHRDLKPGNVLLSAGRVSPHDASSRGSSRLLAAEATTPESSCVTAKVTDFGLARRVEGNSQLTQTNQIMGTPSYMAPEQARATREAGFAADVYAVGAILYECLTGRPPFVAATAFETLQQVLDREPPAPRAINAGVPRDLETIALKCLHKTPERRYPSAAELADDLGRWANGEPILARPAGPVERAFKWTRRRPGPAAGLGGALLSVVAILALAVFASYQWRRADEQRQKTQQALELAQSRGVQTREALDLLTANVIDDWLAQQPVLTAEQRQYLQSVLTAYERFAEEGGSEESARAGMAKARSRVGVIREGLGDAAGAEAAGVAAREEFARLHEDFPDNPEYQAELAWCQRFLGRVRTRDGRYDRARQDCHRALELYDDLIGRHPDDPRFRHRRAMTRSDLGWAEYNDRKWEQADKTLRLAAQEQGDLFAAFPDRTDYRYQQAVALHYLSVALRKKKGGEAEALRVNHEAVATLRELAQKHPERDGYWSTLGQALNDLGVKLKQQRRREEAAKHYAEALAVRRQMAQRYPNAISYALALGQSCLNLGNLKLVSGRPEEALEPYAEGVGVLTRVVEGEKGHRQARQWLRNCFEGQGEALIKRGRYREALSSWDNAIASNDPKYHLNDPTFDVRLPLRRALVEVHLGRIPQALRDVEASLKRATAQKDRLLLADAQYLAAAVYATASVRDEASASKHVAQALLLLRQAIKGGVSENDVKQEKLADDSDFVGLKGNAEFESILASLP